MTKIKNWIMRQAGAVGLVGLAIIVGVMVVIVSSLIVISNKMGDPGSVAMQIAKGLDRPRLRDCPAVVDLDTEEIVKDAGIIQASLESYHNLLPPVPQHTRCVVLMQFDTAGSKASGTFNDFNTTASPSDLDPFTPTNSYFGCQCSGSGTGWQNAFAKRYEALVNAGTWSAGTEVPGPLVLSAYLDEVTCSVFGQISNQSPWIMPCSTNSTTTVIAEEAMGSMIP